MFVLVKWCDRAASTFTRMAMGPDSSDNMNISNSLPAPCMVSTFMAKAPALSNLPCLLACTIASSVKASLASENFANSRVSFLMNSGYSTAGRDCLRT
jgi:hypothetical protein